MGFTNLSPGLQAYKSSYVTPKYKSLANMLCCLHQEKNPNNSQPDLYFWPLLPLELRISNVYHPPCKVILTFTFCKIESFWNSEAVDLDDYRRQMINIIKILLSIITVLDLYVSFLQSFLQALSFWIW